MDSPYRRELQVALAAVERAATVSQAVLLSSAGRDTAAVEKDDLSPVTAADLAVQALLAASVGRAFPGDVLVGEESAAQLRSHPRLLERVWELLLPLRDEAGAGTEFGLPRDREHLCELLDRCGGGVPGGDGRTWVFDPVDGTKAFVRGEMYAINVALLSGGRQLVGVAACPLLSARTGAADGGSAVCNASVDPEGKGAVLFAARGYGAYVRPLFGAGARDAVPRRLGGGGGSGRRVRRAVTCVDGLVSGVDDGVHAAVAARLGREYPGCDLLGWVPRWAALALGAADATVWVYGRRDYHAKVWDHAGAMLLFEEAGGLITDVDGRPIDLAAGRKLKGNFGFVAALKAEHAEVLAAVQETLRERGLRHLLLEG